MAENGLLYSIRNCSTDSAQWLVAVFHRFVNHLRLFNKQKMFFRHTRIVFRRQEKWLSVLTHKKVTVKKIVQ